MAILHVRNVPEDLYERIRRRAAEEKRSISAEVITLLEAGLQESQPGNKAEWREDSRSAVGLSDFYRRLDEFAARTRDKWGDDDSVDIIREGREERGDW
jgi:plasmid stability protein